MYILSLIFKIRIDWFVLFLYSFNLISHVAGPVQPLLSVLPISPLLDDMGLTKQHAFLVPAFLIYQKGMEYL